MHHRNLSIAFGLALGVSAAMFSTGSMAEAITGKTNLVCAAANVVACSDGDCLQGQAQTFELPTFMFIDVDRKVVHATNKNGKEVASPVKNVDVTKEAFIAQGMENHRGWTLGVERATGAMTMSSTGSEVSFIVFGNCIEY